MTNVPGPREKLQFCGATLEQTMFWVPQSGDVGLGVSILSYGGGVQFGVITDSALCPDAAAHHRRIRARVRPAVDGDADAAVGRGMNARISIKSAVFAALSTGASSYCFR